MNKRNLKNVLEKELQLKVQIIDEIEIGERSV